MQIYEPHEHEHLLNNYPLAVAERARYKKHVMYNGGELNRNGIQEIFKKKKLVSLLKIIENVKNIIKLESSTIL